MQLLYSQSRDAQLTKTQLLKRYDESIDAAAELLLYTIYVFLNTTCEAVDHEKTKRGKYLPSERDQNFTAKLFSNPLIQSLDDNKELDREFAKYKFGQRTDQDFFKKIYTEFAKTEAYEEYVYESGDENEVHKNILLELFRFLRKNELFNEMMQDEYVSWKTDKSLVVGSMKKIIKALPTEGKFYDQYFPDDETSQDYGRVLLEQVCDNEPYLLSLIEPTLKNWDADRLAIIDMILLKMALAEFMFFPTIPTKVTLNEYVEVSKQYSTPKSKDFINGILDRLMKTLHAEGKIKKEGRGLLD